MDYVHLFNAAAAVAVAGYQNPRKGKPEMKK
jgi:hypothetical protein